MKSSRYSPEQVAFAMRQAESGTPVPEVCRKMGIAEQTFYRWKKKYAGMGVAEVRKLRILEEENRKLKQLVADLSLDKQMLQDVLRKKRLAPALKREVAKVLRLCYQVSERRVCKILSLSRTSCRYLSRADEQVALRIRLRDLAYARVSYGYRRLHVLLRREGWRINHNRGLPPL